LFSCIATADLAATITTSVLVMMPATLLIGPVAVFSARTDAVRPAILDHGASLRSARPPVIPGDFPRLPRLPRLKKNGKPRQSRLRRRNWTGLVPLQLLPRLLRVGELTITSQGLRP
jgi:hypothetical protein